MFHRASTSEINFRVGNTGFFFRKIIIRSTPRWVLWEGRGKGIFDPLKGWVLGPKNGDFQFLETLHVRAPRGTRQTLPQVLNKKAVIRFPQMYNHNALRCPLKGILCRPKKGAECSRCPRKSTHMVLFPPNTFHAQLYHSDACIFRIEQLYLAPLLPHTASASIISGGIPMQICIPICHLPLCSFPCSFVFSNRCMYLASICGDHLGSVLA